MRYLSVCALLLLFAYNFAFGQAQNQSAADSLAAGTIQAQAVQAPDEGPVAVPQPSEKAMRYYRSGNVIWVFYVFWGLLIPALFLFTGFSAKIRDWATILGKKWFFIIGIYFIIYLVINVLIGLPLSYYTGFIRPHDYGLSNQTFAKWLSDLLKGSMVSIIIGVLVLWGPYRLLKKSPRRWWLYTGLLAIPFLIFSILISPIWIAPLFNKFEPMKDKVLEAKILALADKAGIEGSRVYEVNKSVDTKTVNAYVTGIGNTKRIVLWDTIIKKLNEPELLFVMGHEMGHYVLKHVIKSIFFYSALILLSLFLIYLSAQKLIDRYKDRFGFDRLSDIASLPLIILLFQIYSFIMIPAAMAYSRSNEHEADRFGLEITRNNRAAATAFVKLQSENLSNPRPGWLYKIWRSSHPTIGERIDFCNSYKPWKEGKPLKYGSLIKKD